MTKSCNQHKYNLPSNWPVLNILRSFIQSSYFPIFICIQKQDSLKISKGYHTFSKIITKNNFCQCNKNELLNIKHYQPVVFTWPLLPGIIANIKSATFSFYLAYIFIYSWSTRAVCVRTILQLFNQMNVKRSDIIFQKYLRKKFLRKLINIALGAIF